jgi:hypothetical protein
MGTRIIEGTADGSKECAVFYCSASGIAFGPLMRDADEAEAFQRWLPDDPRRIEDLRPWLTKFREIQPEEPGCIFDADGFTARLFRGHAVITATRARLDAPVVRLACRSESIGSAGDWRVTFAPPDDAPPWLTAELLTALSDASVGVL